MPKKIHFLYLSLEIEFVEKRLNGSGDCCNIALIGSCRHISRWKKPYCGESLSKVVSTIDQLWSPPSWNWWSEEKGKEKRSVTTPLGKILREWKTLVGKCQKPKLAQLAVNECTRSFKYSIGTILSSVTGAGAGGMRRELRCCCCPGIGLALRHKYGLGSWDCGGLPAENKWLLLHTIKPQMPNSIRSKLSIVRSELYWGKDIK